jgi:hypothetical protein
MNCYVCATDGRTEAAVALCPRCHVGLCLTHLRAAATDPQRDRTHLGCSHDAWQRVAALG